MEDVVNFETAKLLKKVGFNFSIYNFYVQNNNKSKPYLTTGLDYDSDRDCKWDWNLNGGESGFQSKIIPYPNDSNLIYTSAPTQSLAQKWLRDKHNIYVTPLPSYTDDSDNKKFNCEIFKGKKLKLLEGEYFKNYEEALEKGLLYALQMI